MSGAREARFLLRSLPVKPRLPSRIESTVGSVRNRTVRVNNLDVTTSGPTFDRPSSPRTSCPPRP